MDVIISKITHLANDDPRIHHMSLTLLSWTMSITSSVVQTAIVSHLDYDNPLLAGLPLSPLSLIV